VESGNNALASPDYFKKAQRTLKKLTCDIRPDIHGPGCPGIPFRIFKKFPLAETGTEAVLLPFVVGGILRIILIDRCVADRIGRHFSSQQIV
jgi:hypothetical protein